ncbi:MAG: PhnA-like protein, partial [Pseudomonadota bacterium]|nr:PhnA-like protein [Pseudomonadota bacterium]
VDQVQQQAADAADTAASIASTAALFGFIALVLGGIASWFGGRFGTVEPTITAFRTRVGSRKF